MNNIFLFAALSVSFSFQALALNQTSAPSPNAKRVKRAFQNIESGIPHLTSKVNFKKMSQVAESIAANPGGKERFQTLKKLAIQYYKKSFSFHSMSSSQRLLLQNQLLKTISAANSALREVEIFKTSLSKQLRALEKRATLHSTRILPAPTATPTPKQGVLNDALMNLLMGLATGFALLAAFFGIKKWKARAMVNKSKKINANLEKKPNIKKESFLLDEFLSAKALETFGDYAQIKFNFGEGLKLENGPGLKKQIAKALSVFSQASQKLLSPKNINVSYSKKYNNLFIHLSIIHAESADDLESFSDAILEELLKIGRGGLGAPSFQVERRLKGQGEAITTALAGINLKRLIKADGAGQDFGVITP